MKFYACSQRGIGKFESEDRITIGRSVIAEGSFISEIDNGIVAIADGVGGEATLSQLPIRHLFAEPAAGDGHLLAVHILGGADNGAAGDGH